jgi:hypothetical protein
MPEAVVRGLINELESHNDEKLIGVPLKRFERAVDDPIREMEGMYVDEYGRSELVSCKVNLLKMKILRRLQVGLKCW